MMNPYLPTFTVLFLVCFLSFSCNNKLNLADDDDNKSNLTEIPDAIQAYLTENYPEYEIDEAEAEVDCTGQSVIEIEIEKGKSELELTFTSDGILLFEEVEGDIDQLPSSVRTAILQAFPGYEIDDELDILTQPDGTIFYELELENDANDQEIEVRTDSNGQVICQEEEND
jgi:hypothetical protein